MNTTQIDDTHTHHMCQMCCRSSLIHLTQSHKLHCLGTATNQGELYPRQKSDRTPFGKSNCSNALAMSSEALKLRFDVIQPGPRYTYSSDVSFAQLSL
eukprot:1505262-Amphidinium_carterae.2